MITPTTPISTVFDQRIRRYVCGLTMMILAGAVVAAATSESRPPEHSGYWVKKSRELAEAPRSPLPEWFEGDRVQGFTRLRVDLYESPAFQHAAEAFERMGARSFVRHVKSAKEDPWWNTAFPADAQGNPLLAPDRVILDVFSPGDRNIVKESIDDAHARGMHMLGYYWPMTDESVAELYPEAICRDPAGEVINHRRRGIHMDITFKPYSDIIAGRLLELAEMGIDGFFFDEQHLPPLGSWGTALEAAYTEATGKRAPQSTDPDDPDYRDFIDFKSYKMVETFRSWKEHVHAKFPDVVFVISATRITGLHIRQTPLALARISGVPKNEYTLPVRPANNIIFRNNPDLYRISDDIRLGFGWTLLRSAAGEGHPPYFWAPGTPNTDHTLAYAGALVGYGCIAGLDAAETYLDGQPDTELEATRLEGDIAAYAYGRKVSPVMQGTVPYRWAAVYYSEDARNRAPSEADAWREVNAPALSAFEVCVRARVPVNIVTELDLNRASLEGYKVIFINHEDRLTGSEREAFEGFRAEGGVLIDLADFEGWGTRDAQQEAARNLRAKFDGILAASPLSASGGPEHLHMIAFSKPATHETVINFTNDVSWVQEARAIERGEEEIHPAPPPVSEVVFHGTGLPPKAALDVVGGRMLPIQTIPGGYEISIPSFRQALTLVLSFD